MSGFYNNVSTHTGIDLIQKFADILERIPESESSDPRPMEDILAEMLDNTRHVQSRLRRLESRREFSISDDQQQIVFGDRAASASSAKILYRCLRDDDTSAEDIVDIMEMSGIPKDYII